MAARKTKKTPVVETEKMYETEIGGWRCELCTEGSGENMDRLKCCVAHVTDVCTGCGRTMTENGWK